MIDPDHKKLTARPNMLGQAAAQTTIVILDVFLWLKASSYLLLVSTGQDKRLIAGIKEYLRNCGTLEVAQQMANHEPARTTGLYDRRND